MPLHSQTPLEWGLAVLKEPIALLIDHAFLLVPAQDYVGQFLASFRQFPQRQKAASFNMDEVMSQLGGSMLMENQGLGAPAKP